MAVRTFKAITVGSITETARLPYNVKELGIRGVAILSSVGTGAITLKFMDGSTMDTPRMSVGVPYQGLFEKQIQSIESIGSITAVDIEFLKEGV